VSVALTWAQAANGVIGDRGTLPWQLPEDLARFRLLTLGSTVVMGRVTWQSLPDGVRPLPERRNVVLTRQATWTAPGAVVAGSVAAALAQAPGDVWVIGGASVYRDALPHADKLVITQLAQSFPGDVYAPDFGSTWQVTDRDPDVGSYRSRSGVRYWVLTYGQPAEMAPGG